MTNYIRNLKASKGTRRPSYVDSVLGSGCLLIGCVNVQANEVPSASHSPSADWE